MEALHHHMAQVCEACRKGASISSDCIDLYELRKCFGVMILQGPLLQYCRKIRVQSNHVGEAADRTVWFQNLNPELQLVFQVMERSFMKFQRLGDSCAASGRFKMLI